MSDLHACVGFRGNKKVEKLKVQARKLFANFDKKT